MSKRNYWLRLKETHFNKKVQKKMRRQEDGTVLQIIYLRLMLLGINEQPCGTIYYEGVYDSIEEEIAEELNEDEEDISRAIEYFISERLIERTEEGLYIPEVETLVGSETDSAEKMRKWREEKKKQSQCDQTVMKCNDSVTECNDAVKESDTEKSKEDYKESIEDYREEWRYADFSASKAEALNYDNFLHFCNSESMSDTDITRFYSYIRERVDAGDDWKAKTREIYPYRKHLFKQEEMPFY